MTAAQSAAYDRARALIAQAEGARTQSLSFFDQDDLIALPPELARLTWLESLNLDGTRVADLTPVRTLSALVRLDLISTQAADLSPLAGLTNLRALSLAGTRVTDLAPLAGLTALESLDLEDTPVADLRPLARMQRLIGLDLEATRVTDLAPLVGLKELRSLNLDHSQVSDLCPLLSLERLWEDAGQDRRDDAHVWAIWFQDIPATDQDPHLAALSGVTCAIERARRTRAYLERVSLSRSHP